MRLVIRDLAGVTHTFEAALGHNTRCGQWVYTQVLDGIVCPTGGRDARAVLQEGVVDCMTCLVGGSHLTSVDLRNGVGVEVYVRLYDMNGAPVSDAHPITFTRGMNVNSVTFDSLPIGVTVYGYAYETDDGRSLLRNVHMFPGGLIRRSEGDSVMIEAGAATVIW